jgi:ribosomal protein S18 acetylase RimI-like enzyme
VRRFEVRPAARSDAGLIADLIRRFSREDGHDSPITGQDVLDLAFGPSPRFMVLLAEEAGRPLGYVLFYPSFDTDHAAKGFYLQDVYVLPEDRRRGVGRALMAAAARACIADGGCYLFWNALVGNQAGRAFYRRIGAREEAVVTLSLQPDTLRRLAEQHPPEPADAR